eukprot:CAMPEP_0169247778 /NCGR_PEP_ID=MMETSP1016-20121227/35470_1 /TAXON_ID=342587 /ORGANISM="Karlodinium micrum, Strain CCMP2283" /LENGTH=34 /DNA_ID= /DNA_START= /DNA_END= /DNA_ORIENTATION=
MENELGAKDASPPLSSVCIGILMMMRLMVGMMSP